MRISRMIWGTFTVIALAGCGSGLANAPDLVPVSGTVLLKGQPAAGMDVIFYPSSGGAPSFAQTNEQGKFELSYNDGRSGAVPAVHRVVISKAAQVAAPTATGEVPAASGNSKEWVEEVTVSAGQPSFNLKLD